MLTCPECQSDDLNRVAQLPDGRRRLVCLSCGHTWDHGVAAASPRPRADSFTEARRRFPTPEQVDPARRVAVDKLKAEFLKDQPEQDPAVAPYWRRYQQVFSKEGLATCEPQDLKSFANTTVGANPGNMSVFNTAWNALGTDEAARRTRDIISYLLYGPADVRMADRLTRLILETDGMGMKGFKESLLTKVLCIMEPRRFLPILTYSSPAGGKREIAQAVYGLDLPRADQVSWTIGRLILWSNDLLGELAGDGFVSVAHKSEFLWTVSRPGFSGGSLVPVRRLPCR